MKHNITILIIAALLLILLEAVVFVGYAILWICIGLPSSWWAAVILAMLSIMSTRLLIRRLTKEKK